MGHYACFKLGDRVTIQSGRYAGVAVPEMVKKCGSHTVTRTASQYIDTFGN